jgi:hypothetical protein
MMARGDITACAGAVVRKPPGKEPAGDEVPTMARYGDLIAVLTVEARRESAAVR